MKAIILAAGKGTRLYPLTKSKPKCLVKVGKKTLIEHEIDNLIKIGIKNFIILVGPFENQIKSLLLKKYKNVKFNFIKNPKYMTTNYIYSMWLTKKHLQEDKKTKHILLLHGDILFDYDLLELIMKSKQNVVPVNKHMKLPEKDFKARIQNGKVVEIGTKIFEENCYASFPIYKIKKQDFLLWLEEIEQLINEKKINNYAEDALSKQMKLYPLYFKNNFCMEIDNIQDLKIAKKKSFNKVVACYRRYPLPGGRNTLLTFLKERNDIEVINNKDLKSPFKGMKYGLKCFQQLKKLKPDVVLSMGLYGEGALLYSRISNKKGIYNLSGFRFKIYNLFNKKVLSELISMFLCDKIILPSKEAADQIKKYAPIFKKKNRNYL